MTDLLGICTAWGDGDVRGRSPSPATRSRSALADIVSGKPVPPRPSVRHRVSPLRAPSCTALALFPDLETEPLGDWLLRRSPTATARRANSVLAFGAVRRRRRRRAGRRALRAGRSRPCCRTRPRTTLFRGRGWVPESHDARHAVPGRGGRPGGAGVARTDGVSTARPTSSSSRPIPAWSTARIGDLASGVAAYADDWVGFRSIEVAPEQRRRGLAPRGDGRAARVGRRAGRDHGVPPGAGRQRARAGALRAGSGSRPTTPTAT